MNIKKFFKDIQNSTDDIVFLHDMTLPISSESMYNIMAQPSNWAIVNFPIIKKVEIVSDDDDYIPASYGIIDWVENMTEKPISMTTLYQRYTIIGL